MNQGMALIVLFLVFISNAEAQKRIVIYDAVERRPIEFANVVVLKMKKGSISNSEGVATLAFDKIAATDTILVSHISYDPRTILYKDFELLDSIKLQPRVSSLSEVLVTSRSMNIANFRKVRSLGYLQRTDDGLLYMRPGEQIALALPNTDRISGFLSAVKLHFDKLLPDATFRVRLKEINNDGTWGSELIRDGVVIKPSKLREKIDLRAYSVLFPRAGVVVILDYLGDGKSYQSRMDARYCVYRLTKQHPEANTFANFMDSYHWAHWNTVLRNQQNPLNAQIQVDILSE